jgi:hypothetical protein
LIVTGVSVSDFATYSGNSDVSDIAVEATIADLEGATGAVTLTTIKGGSSIAKLSELKITDLSVSDYNSHFDSIIQPASSVSYSLKDSPDNLVTLSDSVLRGADSVEINSSSGLLTLAEMQILSEVVEIFRLIS